jgi:hypothetical protein
VKPWATGKADRTAPAHTHSSPNTPQVFIFVLPLSMLGYLAIIWVIETEWGRMGMQVQNGHTWVEWAPVPGSCVFGFAFHVEN